MSLPPEVEASYITIIDSILAASDLQTISAKRIRKGLQAAVDHDITSQKDAITQLIMARFDKFNSEQQSTKPAEPAEPAPTPATNGVKPNPSKPSTASAASTPKKRPSTQPDPSDESELSSVADPSPPKKKQKKSRTVEDDDAAFAARLQAEENIRARPTRGGTTRKRAPAVQKKGEGKKKKAKSKTRIDGDDDSGIEDGAEVKRTGGFHKPMTLSPPLAELLGETSLSRPQTVKKIWEYVKERDLQDPSDKRQIRCDERMRAVFKQDRVHMFTMNKILNQNLYAQDE